MSASVNTILSQLEREPGEFIVDRWVSERLTLVAEQRQRVVAAVPRYAGDDNVGTGWAHGLDPHQQGKPAFPPTVGDRVVLIASSSVGTRFTEVSAGRRGRDGDTGS